MLDAGRISPVRQEARDPGCQPKPSIGGLQEQQTRIRGHRRLVELGQNGPTKKLWEKETLCRRIRIQEEASCVLKRALHKLFLARGGFFVCNFVNNPG
jgi:hypothetical protein